jgi:hypothetical protein
MYMNDLNSTYIYEHERRLDEMRESTSGHLLPRKTDRRDMRILIVLALLVLVWFIL